MSTGAAELLQDTGGTITDEAATTTGEIAARSPLALFWRRLRRDKVALVALAVIVLLIIVAIFAGQIVKLFGAHPPNAQNSDALDDVRLGRGAGPRLHHGDRRARARRLQPHDLRRAHIARRPPSSPPA